MCTEADLKSASSSKREETVALNFLPKNIQMTVRAKIQPIP